MRSSVAIEKEQTRDHDRRPALLDAAAARPTDAESASGAGL
jgi:hypothetical protein